MKLVTIYGGAVLALLLSLPRVGQADDDTPPPPIPDALRPAVAEAERVGRLLQRLDRAAWVATDVMQGDRDARKLRKSVRGWITMPTDTGTRVGFFDDGIPARPVYFVEVDQTGRTSGRAAAGEDVFDDTEQAMIRARHAAISQSFLQCSRTYNTVVYPEGDAIHVYLMAGTTKHDVYPAGGHHRFTYDASGTELRSSRGFTRACIDLDATPPGKPGEHQPGMLFITHLLDPQPTEIHAFISLNAGVPLMVATASAADPEKPAIWAVEEGRISLVDAGGDD